MALTSNPLPISDPETLGFLAHRLQRMISFLETTVAQQNLPGAAVLIAGDGEIACRTVAGLQNVETGDPLQLDTIYRIASMTSTPMPSAPPSSQQPMQRQTPMLGLSAISSARL